MPDPLTRRWVASNYDDMELWGVLSEDNAIIVTTTRGIGGEMSKQTCEKIADEHNALLGRVPGKLAELERRCCDLREEYQTNGMTAELLCKLDDVCAALAAFRGETP